MKNTIFIFLILLATIIFAVISQKEVDKMKSEAKRLEIEMKQYKELYLNCKLNHDLHMKQHEGEFEPM